MPLSSELWCYLSQKLSHFDILLASLVCKEWNDIFIVKRTDKVEKYTDILEYSAKVRHLNWDAKMYEKQYLDFLEYKKYFTPQPKRLDEEAALWNYFDILVWTRKNGLRCLNSDISPICDYAARHGNLEMLKWAHKNGYGWSRETCYTAALHGYFSVLKWLIKNKCPKYFYLCSVAARIGHLEMLKWLRKKDFIWCEEICSAAAESGHFEVLKWARENGCPWDETVLYHAVKRGDLPMLQWVYEQGCPWKSNNIIEAIESRHIDVIKWAMRNQLKFPWISGNYIEACENAEIKKLLRGY